MKRIAIFVEGRTEQLFVERLLREVAGNANIVIKSLKATKGLSFVNLEGIGNDAAKYCFLIFNCAAESRVKSAIIDRCEKLHKAGYEKIIGLLDVYPNKRSELTEIKKQLRFGVPTKFCPIIIILSIMEIEAWFLAEVSHFSRISPSINIQKIVKKLGFNPSTDNLEDREHPAKDLHEIYKIAGLAYKKQESKIKRTIDALDYANIYIELPAKNRSLKKLINEIEDSL